MKKDSRLAKLESEKERSAREEEQIRVRSQHFYVMPLTAQKLEEEKQNLESLMLMLEEEKKKEVVVAMEISRARPKRSAFATKRRSG